MERRTFLKFSSAGLASLAAGGVSVLSWQQRAQAAVVAKSFTITEGHITQPDGVSVYFRGFSNSSANLNVPGESLIAQQGDTIQITINNTLQSDHSFVIDSLGVNEFISAGTTRTFSFTPDKPGTFMYYDGLNAPYNRISGLHGGIAIMPTGSNNTVYPGSLTFVAGRQFFWMFHEVDPAWHAAFANNTAPTTPYVPRYFTLNGLSGRPPGAPGSGNPSVDSMHDPRSVIHGKLGDRTLIRCLNAGRARHSIHIHANHMEWLSENGKPRADIWFKDVVPLDGNGGNVDVIYPFEPAPDAWPPMTNATLAQAAAEGRKVGYPMHLHDETTQTAGGGLYLFGAMTDIFFEA